MKNFVSAALQYVNPRGFFVQAKNKLIDNRQHVKNIRWMNENWPEARLNIALANITYCDKETFMDIYSKYKKIQHPNIDPINPTHNLKNEVESIAIADLTRVDKARQIAQAIVRYIQNHPERRFCRKLLISIDRLQSNSSRLEAEANLASSIFTRGQPGL